MMQLSDRGLRFVASWEGFRSEPYLDSHVPPIATIAFGHVIKPGEHFDSVTEDEGLEILRSDVRLAEQALAMGVKVPITQNQTDALVSFIFNCGGNAFLSSTLLHKLNAGDTAGAADEFGRWVHAGAGIDQGLVNRRKAEREMFLTPDEDT